MHFIADFIWRGRWIFHFSISKFISILVLMFRLKSLLFPKLYACEILSSKEIS